MATRGTGGLMGTWIEGFGWAALLTLMPVAGQAILLPAVQLAR